MANVTNGVIEYNRRLRTGDFEHKDAKVSLSFTLGDGENVRQVMAAVAVEAVLVASQMVGEPLQTVRDATAVAVESQTAPVTMRAAADPNETVRMAKKVQEATVVGKPNTEIIIGEAKPAAAAADPMSGVGGVSAAPVPGPVVVNGAASDPMNGVALAAPGPAPVALPSAAPSDPAAGQTISDEVLVHEITAKVNDLKTPHGEGAATMVMRLIADFVGPPPRRSRDMTQEQRVAFLAKLKEMS